MHLVTGAAGFVGVNLIRALLTRGLGVLALDDLSRGRREFLAPFEESSAFRFARVDCTDGQALRSAASGEPIEAVWHLAANSDIPGGVADPRVDLHQTFMTTFALLLFMREAGVARLNFASSSAIYGDHGDVPIHETLGPLEPISNYGAMKLASEAQIRAAVEAFLPRANVFRFPNVIGVPATHGVILDFMRKLKATPDRLDVLGDGTQQKAYLHVSELVDAMLRIADEPGVGHRVYNIGPVDDGVTVRSIAEAVRDRVAPGAEIRFGDGGRGWVGDVPRFRYLVDKIRGLGWSPHLDSRSAVTRAIDEIASQEFGG